ncbi:phytoene desaturase family protein [Salinicoccus sesuvii]|uniref:4,4'-diapophytoene desaturase (4,4'-diaponeurosporene-forming) n=1 Tax=Salinicoccus sesuvii TaxID=868281 RepID=A0ABV7N0S9_9STAP
MTKTITIIGAGVAGLASAVRLQNEGYDVIILEKESTPGGKMNRIDVDGYYFDLGPTIVMMPELYREVFELAGRDPEDYIPMQRLDPMYSGYFDNGTKQYQVTNDLVKNIEMFEEISDKDAEGFMRYLSDLYGRFNVAKKHFLQRPFRSQKDFYNPFMIGQGLKLRTLSNAENLMKKYIKDKRMRQMISFQTLYIGVSPFKGPSLYTIIPMIEFLYGVWFIKGGMRTMASGMERLFLELGGKVEYDSSVERIVIEDNKAIGVSVDGTFVPSDYVMCNADFPYALKHLVEKPEHKGKYVDEKIDKMDYSCSCFVLYLGMDRKYPEIDNVHNFVFSEDLDTNINQIFDGDILEDPSLYMYVASKIDPSLAPKDKDGIYILMPVSDLSTMKYEWTDEITQLYRDKIIEKIKMLPGMADFDQEIVTEKRMTPHEFEGRFNAYNGATFGLRPTLTQSNHMRPQSKATHCDNLYFTGSSTHPGAGVPIVLLSSKIAVGELLKDENHR